MLVLSPRCKLAGINRTLEAGRAARLYVRLEKADNLYNMLTNKIGAQKSPRS